MLGVLVNTVAVLIGSTIGLLFKKGIPQKYSDAVMTGIALCTVYIGISGALKGENTIVLIVSMALGAALGTLMDLDSCLNRLGRFVEKKFSKNDGTATDASCPSDNLPPRTKALCSPSIHLLSDRRYSHMPHAIHWLHMISRGIPSSVN